MSGHHDHQLKPLSSDGIPAAIEKAEHYRLLNEPMQAESICADVLAVDPNNQKALVIQALSLSDQFSHRLGRNYGRAMTAVSNLSDEYQQTYYEGIVAERRALAHLKSRAPGSGHLAHEFIHKALDCYAKAEGISPDNDDSAILRWNTCVRIINDHPEIEEEYIREYEPDIEG